MATPQMSLPKLAPGFVVGESGIYLVEHQTGHAPNRTVYLVSGLELPSCPECDVTYKLLIE